jgi:HEAT repeats
MVGKEQKQKIKKKTLLLVVVTTSFLGASVFAVLSGLSTRQKDQQLAQLIAEEQFSRLPQFLLTDSSLPQDPESLVVRFSAAAILKAKEAIPKLIALLQDPSDNVRYIAEKALRQLNNTPDKFTTVSQQLAFYYCWADESNRLKPLPCRRRKKISGVISRELISLLPNLDKHVRKAKLLGELNAKGGISGLIALLQDPDRYVRSYAAETLGELNAKEAIPKLILLLQDPNDSMRYIAAEALGKLNAKDAIPKLIALLQSPNENLRFSAVRSLTKIYLASNQKHSMKITHVEQARLGFNLQLAFTGIAVISSISFLLLMLQQIRYFQGITWSGYWICYFPEEVVQDLADLSDQLAQEGKTTRQIRTRIYAEILTLIWVFYIQVNIENLWLPKGDRRIDD